MLLQTPVKAFFLSPFSAVLKVRIWPASALLGNALFQQRSSTLFGLGMYYLISFFSVRNGSRVAARAFTTFYCKECG